MAFTRLRRCLLLDHDEVEQEGLLHFHSDVFYLATTMLLLDHDEAESKGLLLGRGDASYSAMTKPSQRVFYSSAAMSSTQLQGCLLLGPD